MDYPDLVNGSNVTFDHDITPEESYSDIAHEIIFTLFCIVGVIADTVIIYAIFHFQRMRTVPNIFLANWAIADLCSLVVTPSGYRIISIVDHFSISARFMCTLYQLGAVLHATVMVFVLLVTIDWFIAAYFQWASEKIRKYYRYVVGSLWIIMLLFCSISTSHCISRYYIVSPEWALIITYCATLLCVIVFQLSRVVQKYRGKPLEYPALKLTLATVFVTMYIFSILNVVFGFVYYSNFFAMVACCAIFGSSIANFCVLYRCDNDFQACFLQIIKRPAKRYETSITDFDEVETPNGTNEEDDKYKDTVQVSFNNPTEALLTNAF